MVDQETFWQVWKLLQYLALDYSSFSFMLSTNMYVLMYIEYGCVCTVEYHL